MGPSYYTELLDPYYAGRRWIIAADAAAGATERVRQILAAGGEAVMVIAGNEGTGPQPPPEAEVIILGTKATTIMGGIRAFASAITSPSRQLCAAVDAFDAAHEAAVVTGYVIPSGEVCGRRVWGGARPEWKALEDKLVADGLWDRAGIVRAPSAIVESADEAECRRAIHQVASDDGAVVVADNTEGWHGGGEYARHVAPGADPIPTLRFFMEHSRRVRIMPFLRGVPCSIHGIVTSDRVLAFRPVEMLVFRRRDSDQFVYTGMSTVWDPPSEVRNQMRSAAVAVGSLLRAEVGYRGAFGIDGVHTRNGFRPTELNPRLTPGLLMQTEAAGGYPMRDIERAVVAGLDVDLRFDELERNVVAGADATRSGRWHRPLTHLTVGETIQQPIDYVGPSWSVAGEGAPTAIMSLGPSAQGGMVRVTLAAEHRLAAGPSIAEAAATSLALADELWDTRIGTLIPGMASPT